LSRGSRLALVILAVVLMLAPAAALHPVVAHLYAAGLSNLWIELTHPPVLVVLLIGMASVLPATGFTVAMVRAARGMPHLQALMRNSRPERMETFDYRVLPSDAVLVFTAGLFRPVTFVSAGAERALGTAGLRAALLHEEAHRRSQDVMWRLLLRAIGRGFAFVPWINDMVESETLRTECAADDYAIRGGARRLDLFEAIAAALPPRANSVTAGVTDAIVELRLTRLVHPDMPLPGRPARGTRLPWPW
jgi:hypothetical protein